MSISLNNHESRIKNLESSVSGGTGCYWITGGPSGNDIVGNSPISGGFNTGFVSRSGNTYTLQPGSYIFDYGTTCGARGEAVDAYANVTLNINGSAYLAPLMNAHAVWWNSDDVNYAAGYKSASQFTAQFVGKWWGPVSSGAGYIRITKISLRYFRDLIKEVLGL